MMGPAALALVGAVLLCLRRGEGEQDPWPSALALAVGLALLGAWWILPPAGWGPGEIRAVAQSAVGAPVGSVVELVPLGADRTFRWVGLATWAEGARGVIIAGLWISALAAVALWRIRGAALRLGLSLLPPLAALAAFAFISKITGPGQSDAEGVRAILQALLADGNAGQPQSFTVPEGAWSMVAPGQITLLAVGVAGLSLALIRQISLPEAARRHLPIIGAALLALAPLWLMLAVGGVVWRPLEGSLWASAILGLAASLDEGAGSWRPATLGAGALAFAAVALSI